MQVDRKSTWVITLTDEEYKQLYEAVGKMPATVAPFALLYLKMQNPYNKQ